MPSCLALFFLNYRHRLTLEPLVIAPDSFSLDCFV
jgi:hypothetical protein